MIPIWVSKYLIAENIPAIESAIKSAELKTDCEIVPMIVKRSSTVGHTFIITFFLLILTFYISGLENYLVHEWTNAWSFEIAWVVLSFIAASWLSKMAWLQRLTTSDSDLESQSMSRATNEFYNHKLDATRNSNAVLLFVSIHDHKAVVLVDKNISAPFPANTWEEVINILLVGAKNRDLGSAYVKAIQKCSEILADKFPIKPNDFNEISNKLIIKE